MKPSNSCLRRPSARAVLILYMSCSACTSWRPDQVTPQAAVQKQPPALRVTRTDSSLVVINNPQLQGDTIVGQDPHKAMQRVPLSSVLLTETRHGDAGKSALAVLGVAAAAFAVAAVATLIGCKDTCYTLQH